MANLKENHILIGLGGTGGKILRAFKMRMFEEFPNKEEREKQPVALLYVDSTREMMGIGRADMDVMGQDASFDENEFLFIKGCDVPNLLDNIDIHPELRGIVNNVTAVRTAIGNLGEAAGQKRRAGRLLFAVNAGKYVEALQDCYAKCYERSRDTHLNIHIFAGLCGGTGSGSIIDAIVQARNIQGWDKAQINVYAMIPEQDLPNSDMNKVGRYYVNGYAALKELNALQCGRYIPCDVLSGGAPLNVFNESIKGVANGIVLYSNVNSNGRIVHSFDELPKIVSDYVYSRVFLINQKASECQDIIRAFNFENMDGAEFEYDECVSPNEVMNSQELPKVRTKKLYSFGIKRVIYPELRVLKHMTYTIGQNVLYQFRYNNWRPNLGFIDEEIDFDYNTEYLSEDSLRHWMLDEAHLTFEEEVLTVKDGSKYDNFLKEWQSRINDFADFCKDSDCPLTEMSRQMEGMFADNFRDEGVRNYFKNKQRSLNQIARKIRSNIEKELFMKWRDGQISITELSQIGKCLTNYVSDGMKKNLDDSINRTKDNVEASNELLSGILTDWTQVGFFGKFITKKKDDLYVRYQNVLAINLDYRTKIFALDFACQLASVLYREIGHMSDDIDSFSKMLSDAIDETNRLISAQQKTNKGLEDMKGAVIEVSEEERMIKYEDEIRFDKEGMCNISRQIREAILPETEFKNFGDLLTRINEQTIKHAFDVKLSEVIQAKHADLPPSSTKILGLNILTQLQQKLGNDERKIREFAEDIMEQSGAYINLDHNQIISSIRNNDQPGENKIINLSETLISIPSPEDNPGLKKFADILKSAFEKQVKKGSKKPKIFMESSRKNELSIITINYAFPMRAITWLAGYKKLYDKYLHTGNANQDLSHAILLHSEGLGENLPEIFAKSGAELRKIDEERALQNIQQNSQSQAMATSPSVSSAPMPSAVMPSAVMPPMPNATVPPPVQPAEPQVQMFLYIGGQQYGPYDYKTLKQFVPTGQLTPQTMVWQQGMAAWTPAGQVSELQGLFAPIAPAPGMPPMPPTPGTVPPPMNM